MSILFDFYEAPPQEGKEDEMRIYAHPVFAKTATTKELADIIHSRCALTEGDILSAITGLAQVISEKLQDGQRVHLEGVGYFSVTLRCRDIKTKKDMRSNNVGVKSVKFRPDKELKKQIMDTKAKRSPVRGYSARLSNEEVDRKVAEYFEENQVMTRKNLQYICQMKPGMAYQHIQRLLEEGKIRNIGIKRQPIYVK